MASHLDSSIGDGLGMIGIGLGIGISIFSMARCQGVEQTAMYEYKTAVETQQLETGNVILTDTVIQRDTVTIIKDN